MKKALFFTAIMMFGSMAWSQVTQTVIVEHFTNSRCGVCASKNPGLKQNLADHPEVIHISFHPSSPYASCIFSQHNPLENDNRTKFYSIFGGTPWIVINGEVQPSSTNFGNPALFDPFLGQTSPFSIFIKEYRFEEDNIQVDVTIKAVSGHSMGQAKLFLGFAEDTVFYNAPNGENLHTNVFRKAMTDEEGDLVSLPLAGDSVNLTYNVTPDAVWNIARMYTIAILQDTDSKMLIQGGKTNVIDYMAPSSVNDYNIPSEIMRIYPNPAVTDEITISQANDDIMVFSLDGRLVNRYATTGDGKITIDISTLQNGVYLIRSGEKSERLIVNR